MADLDPVKQKLGIEIEVDESSVGKAIGQLDAMNEKAKGVSKETKSATEETMNLSKSIEKDLNSSLDKLKGYAGPLQGIFGAAGVISGGVLAIELFDKTMADLSKTMINVNNQFVGYKENMRDIVHLVNDLRTLGISDEQGAGLINQLSKSSAFRNADQLREAAKSSAALSGDYGVDLSQMGTLISNLTSAGTKLGGFSGVDSNGNSTISQESTTMMAKLQRESVEKGFSSMDQYVKSLNELWQTTRNVNMGFETAERVLSTWSEEVRRGIYTAKEIGDFAGGKNMNDSAKLLMAQEMKFTGTPMEMLTKMDEYISKHGIDKELQTKIVDLTKSISSSHGEQVQLVAKFSDMLGGPKLDTFRKKEEFIDPLRDVRSQQEKDELQKLAKDKADALSTVEASESQSARNNVAKTSWPGLIKNQVLKGIGDESAFLHDVASEGLFEKGTWKLRDEVKHELGVHKQKQFSMFNPEFESGSSSGSKPSSTHQGDQNLDIVVNVGGSKGQKRVTRHIKGKQDLTEKVDVP